MAARKVIVFGPTGAVASATALAAAELGAKVVLAMRSVTKDIPGLGAEQEKQGSFERVQADLCDADSVRNAVTKTGAKFAFLYFNFTFPEGLKPTIQALKAAGIEQVVFLSSYAIQGDPEDVPQSDFGAYAHAGVELNLRESFGPKGYVTIRPASFATNTRSYKQGLAEGVVKIHRPEARFDHIVSEDIGRVAARVLVSGTLDGETVIYLTGPELISSRDTVKIIAKAINKDPKVEPLTDEEAFKMYSGRGMPAYAVQYMIDQVNKSKPEEMETFGIPVTKEAMTNIEKYTGRRSTTFEEWVQQNKEDFA